jgi:hypothetical protein
MDTNGSSNMLIQDFKLTLKFESGIKSLMWSFNHVNSRVLRRDPMPKRAPFLVGSASHTFSMSATYHRGQRHGSKESALLWFTAVLVQAYQKTEAPICQWLTNMYSSLCLAVTSCAWAVCTNISVPCLFPEGCAQASWIHCSLGLFHFYSFSLRFTFYGFALLGLNIISTSYYWSS